MHADVYDELIRRLTEAGAHLCDEPQKEALRPVMWPDGGPVPAVAVVAKSAAHIAGLAGFEVDPACPMLLVEETGTGPDHPFSGEKLSVVLAVYRYEGGIGAAADLVNAITAYQGLGHTCGIHTSSDANVEQLAMTTQTARVLVNQNLNEGAGSPRNGLPFTLSLSCGTWGGNITTENVNARHFVNLTWVSRPIEPKAISEEALFGAHWQRLRPLSQPAGQAGAAVATIQARHQGLLAPRVVPAAAPAVPGGHLGLQQERAARGPPPGAGRSISPARCTAPGCRSGW